MSSGRKLFRGIRSATGRSLLTTPGWRERTEEFIWPEISGMGFRCQTVSATGSGLQRKFLTLGKPVQNLVQHTFTQEEELLPSPHGKPAQHQPQIVEQGRRIRYKGLLINNPFPVQVFFKLHPLILHYALVDIGDRKSTRLNSSHVAISYAAFCLKQ